MNSVLNPEAPEFYPHLKTATQDGFKTVGSTVQASKKWPSGLSYDRYKTFTAFNVITDKFDGNVTYQSNKIISTEDQFVLLKRNDEEQNIEAIVDTNDTMLDRLDTHIDSESGLFTNKPKESTIAPAASSSPAPSTVWNASPVIAKIQMGSATLIGAKNIPRPQIHFKDTIDNSDSLWMPRLSDKPNNIKPLALNVLYDDNGEAIGDLPQSPRLASGLAIAVAEVLNRNAAVHPCLADFLLTFGMVLPPFIGDTIPNVDASILRNDRYEHPYKIELDLYRPRKQFLEPSTSRPELPPPLEKTKLTFIDSEDQLIQLVQHLYTVSQIAVDLEHHSYRTYQGITCLIQLTTAEGGDFIIDALALREHLYKLNEIFTNPNKIKIFHGADMDVLWLQRDFGVYIVGLFDTHRAAKALELPGLSLKSLLLRYCQIDADKKYQLADWRMRPLPAELIAYARQDTHYLIYIWKRMRDDLLQKSRQLLLSVFDQSRLVCGLTYKKEVCNDESHLPLLMKSRKKFNSQQMSALKLLYKWRDSQARELDESTGYLLPNHMMLALAETLPRELQGVNACCSPMPPFVKQNCITIHRMILSCRELPLAPQLYRMPHSISAVLNHEWATLDSVVHDRSHYPDYRDDLPVVLNSDSIPEVDLSLISQYEPDVTVFQTSQAHDKSTQMISQLKADAKCFIPPFDRYKWYRKLAQMEEIKEFKEKEAKIAALSKDNALIKEEVLSQLVVPLAAAIPHQDSSETKQRKRKISTPPIEIKSEPQETKEPTHIKSTKDTQQNPIKKFYYTRGDYKKFYNDNLKNKVMKPNKTKFQKK